MSVATLFPDSNPKCPGCGSEQLQDLGQDRRQCIRCGWRIRIDADGVAQNELDLSRAGKTRKSFKTRFVRRWPKRK